MYTVCLYELINDSVPLENVSFKFIAKICLLVRFYHYWYKRDTLDFIVVTVRRFIKLNNM